jgi:lysophospholipase L1-like esterase
MLATIGCASMTRHKANAPVDPAAYDHPVRVACVGDSITFGFGIKNRAKACYPAQLGRMLGKQWEARNFGNTGSTLLKLGNKSYWKQKQFSAAHDFAPDVVVIMLGTNDSKPRNWDKHGGEFVTDYKDLIASFAQLPSRPRIWICKPTPCFPGDGEIANAAIEANVIPAIEQVAREAGIGLIDEHAALAGRGDLFADHVHPNAEGARLIAAAVYSALTGKRAPNPAEASK